MILRLLAAVASALSAAWMLATERGWGAALVAGLYGAFRWWDRRKS